MVKTVSKNKEIWGSNPTFVKIILIQLHESICPAYLDIFRQKKIEVSLNSKPMLALLGEFAQFAYLAQLAEFTEFA